MNDPSWRPLSDIFVADLTRYLPGPFASRELLRQGARVVRLEAPGGDPMRWLAPGWYEMLNVGKESVVCDLKSELEFARALCSRADVVLEGFRPGVAERLDISMTHRAHELIAYQAGETRVPHPLTGGLACYRIYATADERYLTVAALEPRFFRRLCELIDRPELAKLQFEPAAQQTLAHDLAETFRTRTLSEWLALFAGEDVAVGPVNTLAEAATVFGRSEPDLGPVEPGGHTAQWRTAVAKGQDSTV